MMNSRQEHSPADQQSNTVSNQMSVKFIKSADNLSLYFLIHMYFITSTIYCVSIFIAFIFFNYI